MDVECQVLAVYEVLWVVQGSSRDGKWKKVEVK